MSSTYNKLNKQLSALKVVDSQKVFMYNDKTGKYDKNNSNYDIVGKYDVSFPGVVLKANKIGNKTAFIDDLSSLNKNTKTDLIDLFFNKNGTRNKRKVAYLVRTDTKSKTTIDIKNELNKYKTKKGR